MPITLELLFDIFNQNVKHFDFSFSGNFYDICLILTKYATLHIFFELCFTNICM